VLPLILLSGLVQLRNVEVNWSLIREDDPSVVSEPWFNRSATHAEVIRLTTESDNGELPPTSIQSLTPWLSRGRSWTDNNGFTKRPAWRRFGRRKPCQR
jgi:hypothetical protein